MDFVIGHDVDVEVALSVETVLAHLDGRPAPASTRTRVRFTRSTTATTDYRTVSLRGGPPCEWTQMRGVRAD